MAISTEAVEHLKNLLRIDTSNPPGNEWPALMYLKEVLEKEGLKPFLQETAPNRGNLVVRLKGSGEQAPLLMHSHVDVVNAEPTKWKHPPFSAVEEDGFIYGRGAIDMKNYTSQSLSILIQAHREKWPLKRDLIVSVVSDEEAGGKFGMEALVNDHPELVQAEYALGEVGGATIHISGRPFYPIQCGEKGVLWLELKFSGDPGHGSVPMATNAHWKMAQFLSEMEWSYFPHHLTQTTSAFLDTLSSELGPIKGLPFKVIRTPLGRTLLKRAAWTPGPQSGKSASLLAMLTHTFNPTGTSSGRQINVVPSTVTLKVDCRTIPGFEPYQVIEEIKSLTKIPFEAEIKSHQRGHETDINTPLYTLLKSSVEESHSGAKALPMLTTGFTDAGQLQRLGIKCYGFNPLKLPPEIEFRELYHGHNERIPIKGFIWGLEVLERVVKQFCC